MAIAYDSSGQGTMSPVSSGTSKTLTVDVGSSTDRILWVGILTGDNTSNPTSGFTYNGVSLTHVASRQLGSTTQWVGLWYLINPTSGSNTLTWAGSLNETYAYIAWEVLSGVPAATGVVGSNTASSEVASGTCTLSLTTQGDNAWLVSAVRARTMGDHTAGTGATERQQIGLSIGDSNGAKSPTGSYSMAWASVPTTEPIGGVMGHVYVSSGATANTGFFSFM